MSKEVRVRYAPSPTGLQHIGGVRTALYNYFFARSQHGKFILRIEDTDRERYSDESLNDLYETLNFFNIKADEGPFNSGPFAPYVQSQRVEIYRKYAQELIDKGLAYYCFCTPERLEQVRKDQEAKKLSVQGYDRHCASLSLEEAKKRIKNGEKYTIRLRVPETSETSFDDVILGPITRKNSDISPDPIILKSDGYPTYHLANVIDDHLMQITHVMRAQEWIPSTPLHILLYKAFGWKPPLFCHLPMVMGNDGHKLSKRHGSTSLRDFREKGYLPEALMNYITLVGWAYDGQREIFSKEDLEKLFSLEKIHSAPAVFDYKKLDYFNGLYIRKKSDKELTSLLEPFFKKSGIDISTSQILTIVPLIKERLKTLSDAPSMVKFLFEDESYTDKEIFCAKKQSIDEAIFSLEFDLGIIEQQGVDLLDAEKIIYDKSVKDNIKANNLFMPLRVAITYSNVSPPLFESMKILTKEKSVLRIKKAIEFLKK